MLLDTSAWIEYFLATEKADKVKDILKNKDAFTSIITTGELVNWCLKNNLPYENYLKEIKLYSRMIELNEKISILAGQINFERKKMIKNWGMADSIVLSTSIIYDLRIITKDNHFKNLPNVLLI